jgi:ubiquinol-cytochrome c reductase cytochrome b subunit
MLSAIIILLSLPFSDIGRSRGMQFKPISKVFFYVFLSNFLILMQLGAKHVESPFIELGQLSTGFYFTYFVLFMALICIIENTFINMCLDFKLNKYQLPSLLSLESISSKLIDKADVSLVNYSGFRSFSSTAIDNMEGVQLQTPILEYTPLPFPLEQTCPQKLDLKDGIFIRLDNNTPYERFIPITWDGIKFIKDPSKKCIFAYNLSFEFPNIPLNVNNYIKENSTPSDYYFAYGKEEQTKDNKIAVEYTLKFFAPRICNCETSIVSSLTNFYPDLVINEI